MKCLTVWVALAVDVDAVDVPRPPVGGHEHLEHAHVVVEGVAEGQGERTLLRGGGGGGVDQADLL